MEIVQRFVEIINNYEFIEKVAIILITLIISSLFIAISAIKGTLHHGAVQRPTSPPPPTKLKK